MGYPMSVLQLENWVGEEKAERWLVTNLRSVQWREVTKKRPKALLCGVRRTRLESTRHIDVGAEGTLHARRTVVERAPRQGPVLIQEAVCPHP